MRYSEGNKILDMDKRLIGLGMTGLLISGCVDDIENVEIEDTETEVVESWDINDVKAKTSDDIDCIMKVDESVGILVHRGFEPIYLEGETEVTISPSIQFDQEGEFLCNAKRNFLRIESGDDIVRIKEAYCSISDLYTYDWIEDYYLNNPGESVECIAAEYDKVSNLIGVKFSVGAFEDEFLFDIVHGWEIEDLDGYKCRFESPSGELSTTYEMKQTITLIR